MLRAILLSAAAASAAWTPLPDTRCTGDEGQVDGTVPSAAACETLCASRPDCYLFSFCPPGGAEGCGAGGGPQPSSCWFFDLSRLPACTAAKNWTSGWRPEPSPSPPVQPPADWAPRIASGDMAFSGARAETIGAGFFPVVGNGFLAIEMGPLSQPYVNAWPWRDSGSFHLAGVYNGKTWVDPSHRAQLPRLHGFVIAPAGTATLGAAIDFSAAIFYNRTYVNTSACPSTVVEQRAFAHRARRELFVFELSAASATGDPAWPGCVLDVTWEALSSGSDTNLSATSADGGGAPAVWSGATLVPEEDDAPLRSLAVAFDVWAAARPPTLALTPAQPTIALRAALRSDLDVAGARGVDDVAAAAAASWRAADAVGGAALRAEHAAAVAALWESGIELAGNHSFAATVNASLYEITSALRADWQWSTSPGGLGTNGYCGHSFW